ncbi:hypothetical protein [Variovorax soli]|uniref:Ran GTPase-activating protein (RanGAP) involved in mRNA processing and transport n=1 Tax=Variovorax soli TaxID=376815 RepID=A0ABU1NBQ6_9BURK|nr:hypothetical protein [Variovorax soli]MDR6535900.1 Ran GTPase-activating protein (RanGAP) involved in mRNA processing and transport [Variovorax soli]
MHLTVNQKINLRVQPNAVEAPAVDRGARLAMFARYLEPHRHSRSIAFNELVDEYLAKGATPDPGPLIHGCMAHTEVAALREILDLERMHEGMKSLWLLGELGELEWQTLIDAMPADFPAKTLKLSKMCFDHSTGPLLFAALHRMPALDSLFLEGIGVENEDFFALLSCPALKLETLDVVTTSDPAIDVCPLLRKLLGACQLESLSIEDQGAITLQQHAGLAEALSQQTRLDSLQLSLAKRRAAEEIECYMPFLYDQTPRAVLDLSGSKLGTHHLALVLEALSRNKVALEGLFLRGCWLSLPSESCEWADILPRVDMSRLQYLDLCENFLTDAAAAALVGNLEEKATKLKALDMSDNWIGSKTIAAMSSLLKTNKTLVSLSFQPFTIQPKGYNAAALEALADALERNTSLRRLGIRWDAVPDAQCERMVRFLARNEQAFELSYMEGGMRAVLNSSGHLFPQELVRRVAGLDLDQGDALSLSSVNTDAWKWRTRIFDGDDSSR